MDGKSQNKLKRHIAILGAGPAGLSTAELLKEKGYKNITIFERQERAGGKCLSIKIDGKSYELGAGVLTINNEIPLSLAKKYNIPLEQVSYNHSIIVDKNGRKTPPQSFFKKLQILWQLLIRYRLIQKKYRQIQSPGYLQLNPNLCIPFSQFAKDHKITDLAEMINLYFTGFGYNYIDRVPAAYVLKYANWQTMSAYVRKQAYIFPEGIQGLWTRIAREHDVRYSSKISKIIRGEKVLIETNHGKEEFDTLILTTPLDETASFMDLSETEKSLFKKIIYQDYKTILCTLKGFPEIGGYIPDNFSPARSGHPVFWYHRQKGEKIFSFYTLAEPDMSEAEIMKNLENFIRKMGGEITKVHKFISWKYFPHVDSKTLASGFYDRLEELQGHRHSYYAGELINFSCVGFTCESAKALIDKHF